ncbi:MAG: MetQ/NlpA family ABC transporter substrate-binding protein [Coriobacteriia bacterium]|nr:MetQ/NlpA family ABC transporter substrate-binding protein [Coriobacteriia bacterium]
MRRTFTIASLVLALALGVLGLAGCSSDDGATSGDLVVLKVGASPTPHAEILEQVAEDLAAEGYELEIIEYTDYVLPNTDVEAGEIDANYFQHTPYLEDFNAENGTSIVSAASIHFEPLGLYAGKSASIDALPEGGKVAVPNDATNEARALLLLEQEGIITLKDGAGIKATVNDIAENPKNIEFVEVEAAAVPAMLADVDLAVINGNYALSADLSVADALASEASDGLAADTYANIVAVAEGNEDDAGIQALVKVLTSEKIRTFIEQQYSGSVVAVF